MIANDKPIPSISCHCSIAAAARFSPKADSCHKIKHSVFASDPYIAVTAQNNSRSALHSFPKKKTFASGPLASEIHTDSEKDPVDKTNLEMEGDHLYTSACLIGAAKRMMTG